MLCQSMLLLSASQTTPTSLFPRDSSLLLRLLASRLSSIPRLPSVSPGPGLIRKGGIAVASAESGDWFSQDGFWRTESYVLGGWLWTLTWVCGLEKGFPVNQTFQHNVCAYLTLSPEDGCQMITSSLCYPLGHQTTLCGVHTWISLSHVCLFSYLTCNSRCN